MPLIKADRFVTTGLRTDNSLGSTNILPMHPPPYGNQRAVVHGGSNVTALTPPRRHLSRPSPHRPLRIKPPLLLPLLQVLLLLTRRLPFPVEINRWTCKGN